jgi:hypothetical protein
MRHLISTGFPVCFILLTLSCAGAQPSPQVRESIPTIFLKRISSDRHDILIEWNFLEAALRCAGDGLTSLRPVTGFTVERQKLGSGRWTALSTDLPPTARQYLDEGAERGGKYLYRVTARLEGGAETAAETEDPVAGPPIWKLTFIRTWKVSGAAKVIVYVSILKFENGLGRVEAKHDHSEGDRIGWWEETPGQGPTPLHPVPLADGKTIMVDFNVGATLKAAMPVTKILQVRRCKPIYDKTSGEKIGCEPILKELPLEGYEISYEDADGVHQVSDPDATVLAGMNELCPKHLAHPQVPAGDPRLVEAQLLLREADRLWSTDSAASIKVYQRLLQDYKDVVIRLQVRNKVEGRARQADE